MTDAADLLLTNAEVHTLGDPDEVHEAVAVRDGRIVAVGTDYDVQFLAGLETETIDLKGRVLLPGFVDAHTHLQRLGESLVHADLSGATSLDDCLDRLRDRAAKIDAEEWVLGFGYDESAWDDSHYLTRDDLDAVSTSVPVAAFREDMHVASLNSVALDDVRGEMPEKDVRVADGEPTGVVVERAVEVLDREFAPDEAQMRTLLDAATAHANARGVTCVHDMVRHSVAPRVYRDMALAGELSIRVRLNYWAEHLDALVESGLRTNHGSDLVRVGAIKTFTDGSIGGRTARLSTRYADGDGRGTWVVAPAELDSLVERADDEGFQVAAHAIGDEAIDAVLDAYGALEDRVDGDDEMQRQADENGRRHRVEHAELATDDAIERFASLGVVASVQPNFLKWAGDGGLYDARLGDRRRSTNRFADFREAGVTLAFGSDCMPLDPLFGVHQVVNAPEPAQRLDVTAALRAYTSGSAYAGFDEDRLGSIERGACADVVALEASPWENPDAISDIDVSLTVVGGRVVHDGR
ncbi:MAG: amidohydrolase [Halobacteriota archaeon]